MLSKLSRVFVFYYYTLEKPRFLPSSFQRSVLSAVSKSIKFFGRTARRRFEISAPFRSRVTLHNLTGTPFSFSLSLSLSLDVHWVWTGADRTVVIFIKIEAIIRRNTVPYRPLYRSMHYGCVFRGVAWAIRRAPLHGESNAFLRASWLKKFDLFPPTFEIFTRFSDASDTIRMILMTCKIKLIQVNEVLNGKIVESLFFWLYQKLQDTLRNFSTPLIQFIYGQKLRFWFTVDKLRNKVIQFNLRNVYVHKINIGAHKVGKKSI